MGTIKSKAEAVPDSLFPDDFTSIPGKNFTRRKRLHLEWNRNVPPFLS